MLSTSEAALNRAPLLSVATLGLLSILLQGCAVHPRPITDQEIKLQRHAELEEIRHTQPLPSGPITLHQAMARALLYNYDQKVALMQQALALKQADLANYAMLPQIVADAGYLGRSNASGASSRSLITGRQSLEVSTAEDRNRFVSDLTVTWNILDFGVSYLQAHQQADMALLAAEARRVSINNVIQQVCVTYWQAVAAERIKPKVAMAIDRIRAALQDSYLLETQGAGDRLTALAYQRTLLDTLGQLQTQLRQIDQQRIQLATLMGLPLETEFSIALENEPTATREPEALSSIENLEEYALANRAESRQEAYLQRVSAADTRIALLKMLPGVNLASAWKSDSNSYLHNRTWVAAAAQMSWNLLSLASGPAAIRSARAAEELAHTRRLALNVAIMMQVRTAVLAYHDTVESYRATAELSDVDGRIRAQTETMAMAKRTAQKEVVAAELNDILSSLKRDLAYADMQSAAASILASVGIDLLPSGSAYTDIDALTAALDSSEPKWWSAEFYRRAANAGD